MQVLPRKFYKPSFASFAKCFFLYSFAKQVGNEVWHSQIVQKFVLVAVVFLVLMNCDTLRLFRTRLHWGVFQSNQALQCVLCYLIIEFKECFAFKWFLGQRKIRLFLPKRKTPTFKGATQCALHFCVQLAISCVAQPCVGVLCCLILCFNVIDNVVQRSTV